MVIKSLSKKQNFFNYHKEIINNGRNICVYFCLLAAFSYIFSFQSRLQKFVNVNLVMVELPRWKQKQWYNSAISFLKDSVTYILQTDQIHLLIVCQLIQ